MIYLRRNSGFSLMEIMITLGIMSALTLFLVSYLDVTDKELKLQTESIQNRIITINTEKIILNDISNSMQSFNFLNIKDDNNKWFFAYNPSFVCSDENCSRAITLDIPDGESRSERTVYFLIDDRGASEILPAIDPISAYNGSNYSAINHRATVNPNFSLSKSNISTSPWVKNRLMVVSSGIELYDCLNGVISSTSNCSFSCTQGGTCNFPIKRGYKFLGTVNSDERDMSPADITDADGIVNRRFRLCRLNANNSCNTINITGDLDSTKELFDNSPYYPERDNNIYLTPVKIVRYYLVNERGNNNSRYNSLMREVATYDGGSWVFNRRFAVSVGVEKTVFTRTSVTNPLISYEIKYHDRRAKRGGADDGGDSGGGGLIGL